MFSILNLLYVLIGLLLVGVAVLFAVFFALRKYILIQKEKLHKGNNDVNVGIFHPYCNAGGGGERVLWCAVRALQAKYENVKIIIYTGDTDASPNTIFNRAKNIFNVAVDEENTSFVYLKKRHWVEAKMYPYFTLLGQSIGSMILGLEALLKYQPDIYLDTMGYSFTLPIFRFLGMCKVGCYVHYPTISTDMLRRVQNRVYSHNNQNYVVKNPFLTWLKLLYYRIFAKLYSVVGRCSQTVMVNSSWTENHIVNLWDVPFKTHRVYPPCEVNHLKNLQFTGSDNEKIVILSVGQFRPEKDHPLQLQAMYELRTLLVKDEDLWNKLRLVIVGSCRNDEDRDRLKNMQDLSKHLSLENSVDFRVNVSYQELVQLFQSAKIGVHTMWNEHFGIGVVECMAAGLIMVANRSGGPLMDIIETSEGSQTGYLAVDAVDYANCFLSVLYNSKEQNEQIRQAARASVDRFSEKEFEINFLRAVSPLFKTD